tara:strand:- start:1468 stop:2694 length:1227 start_codon:yes stop_codon:yes gene_type:complete
MALNPYLTQYFSRMTDPKFQQAQQQQNLFSALTRLGGGLMAAGAPTTQPGQGQRLFGSAMANFGKDLAGSNQNMQNQMLKMAQLKESMDLNALKKAQIQRELDRNKRFAGFLTRPTTATAPQTIINRDTEGDTTDTYSGMGVSGETQVTKPSADTSVDTSGWAPIEQQLGFRLSKDEMMKARLALNSKDPASALRAAVKDITENRQKMSGKIYGKEKINTEIKLSSDFEKAIGDNRDAIKSYGRLEAIWLNPEDMQQMVNRVSKNLIIQKKNGERVVVNDLFSDGRVDGQGAKDLALIFGFMKMLDPRSVVREGEFTMASQTGGQASYYEAKIAGILSGQKLTAKERRNLMRIARSQFMQAKDSILTTKDSYQKMYGHYNKMNINPVYRGVDYKPKIGLNQLSDTQVE